MAAGVAAQSERVLAGGTPRRNFRVRQARGLSVNAFAQELIHAARRNLSAQWWAQTGWEYGRWHWVRLALRSRQVLAIAPARIAEDPVGVLRFLFKRNPSIPDAIPPQFARAFLVGLILGHAHMPLRGDFR